MTTEPERPEDGEVDYEPVMPSRFRHPRSRRAYRETRIHRDRKGRVTT